MFLLLYAVIVAAMLFVFLVVQERYGASPSEPYKRRFLDKFFLEAPHPHQTASVEAASAPAFIPRTDVV